MADVKLLGAWPSAFSYRVIWALELKGIDYEYIEQDLFDKTPLLLQSNPVHKKVPVLIHRSGGRQPISESMVILHYLDESWPGTYPLLPADPYERAVARFWIQFADEKFSPAFKIFRSSGAEQEAAVRETMEVMETLEEHAFRRLLGEKKDAFFGGDKVNMVDLAYGVMAYWFDVIEDCSGVTGKVIDPLKFPLFCGWAKRFNEAPVIRDNLPRREELFAFYKRRREMILAAA